MAWYHFTKLFDFSEVLQQASFEFFLECGYKDPRKNVVGQAPGEESKAQHITDAPANIQAAERSISDHELLDLRPGSRVA